MVERAHDENKEEMPKENKSLLLHAAKFKSAPAGMHPIVAGLCINSQAPRDEDVLSRLAMDAEIRKRIEFTCVPVEADMYCGTNRNSVGTILFEKMPKTQSRLCIHVWKDAVANKIKGHGLTRHTDKLLEILIPSKDHQVIRDYMREKNPNAKISVGALMHDVCVYYYKKQSDVYKDNAPEISDFVYIRWYYTAVLGCIRKQNPYFTRAQRFEAMGAYFFKSDAAAIQEIEPRTPEFATESCWREYIQRLEMHENTLVEDILQKKNQEAYLESVLCKRVVCTDEYLAECSQNKLMSMLCNMYAAGQQFICELLKRHEEKSAEQAQTPGLK
ncbi:uncharacterized protein NEMAJ01_1200 [Nematocida major]|uniref:uncharacterized protein n=1 Tax=Nematocida major TaxID=1912982 RepID=UPI002007A354|nr:uncharacterized protein NEMAJ01_1200 [Nematocida major]KAH9386304.1 hypothetical protein NEMAJ01_1200 [Nematocida major]